MVKNGYYTGYYGTTMVVPDWGKHVEANKDSKTGEQRLKGNQAKTQPQACKDSKATKQRLNRRHAKTQTQASKDSNARKQRLKRRQVKT